MKAVLSVCAFILIGAACTSSTHWTFTELSAESFPLSDAEYRLIAMEHFQTHQPLNSHCHVIGTNSHPMAAAISNGTTTKFYTVMIQVMRPHVPQTDRDIPFTTELWTVAVSPEGKPLHMESKVFSLGKDAE